MTLSELHQEAEKRMLTATAGVVCNFRLSAWCHITASAQFTDYSLLLSCEYSGRKFYMTTRDVADVAFVGTTQECLRLFERDVLPRLCDFLGISAEYDPIAMGA